MAEIRLENLTKHFGEVRAVDELDLVIRARLLRRAARAVRVRQDDDDEHDRRPRAVQRRARSTSTTTRSRGSSRSKRSVGFVFQNYAIFTHMTVYENLAFGLRMRKPRPPQDEIDREVRAVAGRVGLSEHPRPRRVTRLSVNDLQKVALGRSMIVQAGDLPARRAVLEPRRRLPRVHACRAEANPARDRTDDGLRHPRPGRGDGHGRPDRRDGSRPPAAVRDARRALQPPGEPVRRELHRLGAQQLPAGRARSERRRRRRAHDGHRLEADRRLRSEGAARGARGAGLPLTLMVRPEKVRLVGPDADEALVRDRSLPSSRSAPRT